MPRGFAGMDPDKHHRASIKGGKSAQAKGTAHRFSSAEARAARRKVGKGMPAAQSSPARPRSRVIVGDIDWPND